MNFFMFEFKRFINNPKNKICLTLLSLFFLGLFVVNQTTFQKSFSESAIEMNRINLQESNQSVENLERALEQNPDDHQLAQELSVTQEEQKILSNQSMALKNRDYSTYADLQYHLNRSKLARLSDKNSEEYKQLEISIKYYENVKKVGGFPSSYINDTSESAFTIGRSMLTWLSSIVTFSLITVLVSDSLSNEMESSQIRFYHLIGAKKLKHLLSKLFVPVLVTFVVTLLTFSCLYVIKGVLDHFGTWQFPYLTVAGDIIPIWKVVLCTVLLYFVALIFLASLGQLLGIVCKKSLVVIGLILVGLTGFMTLSQEEWFQPFKLLFPFEYLGYGQIVNDANLLPQNAVLIGVCYLSTLSFVCIVSSYYLYKNHNYRKG